jgi:adenosylmethionine-8-amino-7-oxononanoate aminotransferase
MTFIENGVILRPVGNIVYLPPYIISDSQLQKSISGSQALEIV